MNQMTDPTPREAAERVLELMDGDQGSNPMQSIGRVAELSEILARAVLELEVREARVRDCLDELDVMGEVARNPYESSGPTRAHMRHSHYAASAAMLRKAMSDQSGEGVSDG